MRASRLPAVKTPADFDFSFQPSIKREQIDALHELSFLDRKENVIFLGPPGVGKTHLAISLAVATAEHGRRVYYGALADLITSLEEPQAAHRLQQRLKVLTHPALLIVDEIGYVPISRTGATLFFQLVNRRYETGSTILTSNQSFEEWGRIFGDEVMATWIAVTHLTLSEINLLVFSSIDIYYGLFVGIVSDEDWDGTGLDAYPQIRL